MAQRLFLTLLALLTGLAAQIGPAEARSAQVVAAQQVALAADRAAAKAPRAPVALARLPEPGLLNARRHAPLRLEPAATPRIEAVRTRVDRARE